MATSYGGANGTRAGYYIRGDFIAVEAGKPYADRSGIEHEPMNVKIALGREIVGVQYRSLDALPDIVEAATVGDRIELRVYPRTFVYKDRAVLLFDGAGEK